MVSPAAADWAALDAELAAWQAAGRPAALWWRDDDAVAATPALARLLRVAQEAAAPLCLAVIPAHFEDSLVAGLQGSDVAVVPHGYAHANHAPAPARKSEFGDDRPVAVMAGEIAAGWQRLRAAFGPLARPVFVAPWNRMTDALVPHLPAAGLTGLSGKGPRPVAAVTGITVRDAEVDIIDWRGGGGFLGVSAVLAQIVAGLRRRRLGPGGAAEPPLGILTHHLVLDAAGWTFLAELGARLRQSGAAGWWHVDAVFAGPG